MPTLLVLATMGVLPGDFRLLLLVLAGGGVGFAFLVDFGLRFGAVRAFLTGVTSSWKCQCNVSHRTWTYRSMNANFEIIQRNLDFFVISNMCLVCHFSASVQFILFDLSWNGGVVWILWVQHPTIAFFYPFWFYNIVNYHYACRKWISVRKVDIRRSQNWFEFEYSGVNSPPTVQRGKGFIDDFFG